MLDPTTLALIIAGMVICAIVILALVILLRTFALKPPAAPPQDRPDFDPGELPQQVVERLQEAIRIPTVSNKDYELTDFAAFDEYIAFLRRAFPLFHERCQCETVNDYALIYRWEAGADGIDEAEASAKGPLPVVLMAHYDVVPVEEGTADEWRQPPFSANIADGKIWGRGALDIKSQMIAQMEAAENLMRQGFEPARDIYFCYGHDEETSGKQGALRIVDHMAGKGLEFEGVLDEGGLVTTDVLAGVDVPIGLIGVAEKGHSNYSIAVSGAGGHSSMPPKHTSLGLAAKLIARIEDKPLPTRFTAPVEKMLQRLCGQMGFVVRMAMANMWLFRPLLLSILTKAPETNALVRTTFAATMAHASDATNVLPQTTSVNINVRILQGESVASVRDYLARLAREAGVEAEIQTQMAEEPSPISSADSSFYRLVEQVSKEFYPSTLFTPFLVMGGTDSRRFARLSSNVLRFTPTRITAKERQTVHNTDEALSLENYGRMIAWFERFMQAL
jgi:carboxypeptidase PM20D1